MKKFIAALLALTLLCACGAWAEEADAAPEKEIIPVEVTPVEISDAEAAAEATPAVSPTPAATPEPSFCVGFEDGFSLRLPKGWLYHIPDTAMAEKGVLYCLSDADGACQLYIQRWSADCADMNALKDLIDSATQPQTSGVYSFNGTDFVVYDLTDGDISCCAALLGDGVLNFVFTPQSDGAFMELAAQIMGSFTILD